MRICSKESLAILEDFRRLTATASQEQLDEWTTEVELAEENRLKGFVEDMKVYDVNLPDSMWWDKHIPGKSG